MTFEGLDDDDDEEEEWIPMVETVDDQTHTHEEPSAQRLDKSPSRVAYSYSKPDKPNRPSQSNEIKPRSVLRQSSTQSSKTKLQSIQNKLQDRISIQTHLVDRPLDYFWQRCLINLLRQMWTLEIRIQIGILMLATGLFMRILLWSTWYLLYPRFAILSSVFLASFFYLDPLDMHDQIKGTWNMIEALFSPSEIQIIQGIDAHKLRRLSLVLFVIPSILEIRTLSFLSRINAGLVLTNADGAQRWSTISLYCYNFGVAGFILSVMLFLRRRRRMRPCDVSYHGLLTLYGFSLLVALCSSGVHNARQIPALAAPFLTATATLLLMYKDDSYEWLSRITRQAFRLSLRDVLAMVSESVTDDDMLQLAILRWICDFWASQSEKGPNSPASGRTSFQSGSKQEHDESVSTSETTNQSSSNAVVPFQHNSVRWEELQPMLNIEIDHMETEIDALRTETAHSSRDDYAGQGQNPSRPTTVMNPQNDHPLTGLKEMLLEFDVDERAQPAVLAFRRAVESFPPKKKTAVTISILRRCPALLTIMMHTLFLSDLQSVFLTSLVLLPFVLVEYYRISEWIETCQRVKSTSSESIEREEEQNDWRIPSSLRRIDTMTILLSGDAIRPPSLLIVWFNIVSSVSALEVGLSTARCVETTAVAIEFAGSAMSLVKFGFEISENGLLHGVMVLAGEVLSIYGNGRDIANLDVSDRNTAQYTSAAVRAVRHGQKIVKNIHTISEDRNVVSFAQPLLNFLSMLTGGKREENVNDLSVSPDSDHELHLDDAGLPNENDTNPEKTNDGQPTIESKSEEEELPPTATVSETESTSSKPENANFALSGENISVSNSPAAEEDLAQVMDMIAASYEQGLIDESEKDDFFNKLSVLQKEELHGSPVLSGMKRTLTIILENGLMIPIDNDDLASSNVSHRQSQDSSLEARLSVEIATNVSDIVYSESSQADLKGTRDEQESEAQSTQPMEQNNDIITLGVAALGVVASGLALSMKSDSQQSDSKQHYIAIENNTASFEIERKKSPSVEIVELTDHNTEDEWVSLE